MYFGTVKTQLNQTQELGLNSPYSDGGGLEERKNFFSLSNVKFFHRLVGDETGEAIVESNSIDMTEVGYGNDGTDNFISGRGFT